MNEKELIQKFAQDEEEILLGKRIFDLARRAETAWFSCTDFLTPSQLVFCKSLLDSSKIPYQSGGGYEGAVRQLLLFGEGAAYQTGEDSPICALKLDCPMPVGHRDILGSVLGLGIRREKVGDILVGETASTLLIRRDILPYLTVNLERIGSAPVRVQEVPLASIIPPAPQFDTIHVSVASLRLDAVLAAVYHLSREEAQQQIRRQMAQVDYRIADSPSKAVEPGSILSLRGYGKFLLSSVAGETRRGKLRLEIKKYI